MKKNIKPKITCKNCGHIIWYCAYVDFIWRHKNYLHNDNCKCRKPEQKINRDFA